MRWVLFCVAALAMTASVAQAVETDLSGGVFFFHYDPAIAYTDTEPVAGWLSYYTSNTTISVCEDQNPSIDTEENVLWFVLCAWNEPKVWCFTEFGFGSFDPGFLFQSWGTVKPGNALELPTAGWPGPNEGTGITIADQGAGYLPWTGNLLPVYVFAGYAYEATQIPLDVDPPTDNVGWVNCDSPAGVAYHATCLPVMGILTDGEECCPGAGPTQGACCMNVGDECQLLTAAECAAAGGTYEGDGTDCDPNPCVPIWACCVGTVCTMLSSEDCTGAGGIWQGDNIDCDPNPCLTPTHACCFAGGACSMLSEADCGLAGGESRVGETCAPVNPCPIIWACCSEDICTMTTEEQCQDGGVPPWMTWLEGHTCDEPDLCINPPDRLSWGKVKSIYR